MLHGTSAFIFQHKFLLWLYESALQYVTLVDGPIMDPPISQDEACSIALTYWEWDRMYQNNNWNNIANSDVFEYPELLGGGTATSAGNYYVTQGMFSYINSPWRLTTPVCAPGNQYCDTDLKRVFNTNYLTTTGTSIRNYLTNSYYGVFNTFFPVLHGSMHGMIHTYVGCAMSSTTTAAMDPLFYMHHTNIDRFWNLWCDCRGFEYVNCQDLTNDCPQYKAMNPTPGGAVKKDYLTNTAYSVTLDFTLTYYTSATTATFIPQSQWPTIQQMWSMGDEYAPGWCGLYYRYGADKLAPIIQPYCPDTQWNWVNVT